MQELAEHLTHCDHALCPRHQFGFVITAQYLLPCLTVTNMEVLSRTGQRRLQDILAETTSDGRPYHQDAIWTTSQSRHVMDPSW